MIAVIGFSSCVTERRGGGVGGGGGRWGGRVGDDSPDRSGLVPGAESMRGFDVEPATGRLWILQETGDRVFALRTLTVDEKKAVEPLPLTGAPAQIAVRADAVGTAVSQV